MHRFGRDGSCRDHGRIEPFHEPAQQRNPQASRGVDDALTLGQSRRGRFLHQCGQPRGQRLLGQTPVKMSRRCDDHGVDAVPPVWFGSPTGVVAPGQPPAVLFVRVDDRDENAAVGLTYHAGVMCPHGSRPDQSDVQHHPSSRPSVPIG